MKIKVKTNVLIPEKGHVKSEMELESGSTLGTALIELSQGSDLETMLIIRDHENVIAVDDMWEISVNGRACYTFPNDLEIPLSQGDVVAIWLTPLGGG